MTSPAPSILPTARHEASLTLRPAGADDARAVADLTAMEAVAPLRRPALVAVSDDRVVAALSLADGRVAADPFARTAGVVALLRLRAAGDPSSVAPRRRFLRLGLAVRLVAG
jgi:hypothetical protein